MTWFRRHIQHGSRLALLALAIQMVLSFGHFHAETAQAATGQSVQSSSGSNHAPHQHPADRCDICAVTALAGTALFAAPPVLPLPQATSFLTVATTVEFIHLGAFEVAFQPRAPPFS